ncbi:MAG: asparagine synthetase B, partial [Chitinophagaceae bacterium]
MCGIAGIISPDNTILTRQNLGLMTDAMSHRGPDGEGFWISRSGKAGFGHRRLAIIDLSENGAQPMHFEDRYTIVYNGEIYNYKELRKELEAAGLRFRSESDTEVI